MGFQHHCRLGKTLWSSTRLQQRTKRFLSAVGKDTESHLLPRLYVGLLPESPIPLPRYLSQPRPAAASSSQFMLKQGTILQLSSDQSHYVKGVMRMIGPGSKKGRWSFEGQQPCVRIFDGREEWVAQLDVMDDLGSSGDESSVTAKKRKNPRRRSRQDVTVMARCIVPLRSQTADEIRRIKDSFTAPVLSPILCFAPPKKKERYQWILEKSTELGMDAWLLLRTDRTESASARDYERKGQAYVVEAAEQCESLSLPLLVSLCNPNMEQGLFGGNMAIEKDDGSTPTSAFSKLSDLLEFLALREEEGNQDFHDNLSVLVCRERSPESTPILQALHQIQSREIDPDNQPTQEQRCHYCMVLVGPEGGWSPAESQAFDRLCKEKKDLFWNVSLGSNVLRTDTAAAAAIAAFALHKDQYS